MNLSKRTIALLIAASALLSGCALTATVSADRTINNTLQADQKPAFVVYPLDPRAQHSLEYRSLATSLTRELTAVGLQESAAKPDTLFLVGYAMELAVGGDWDRTLVVYGYDVKTGQRVYEATITSVGQIASAYEVGDVFFQSLAREIYRTGQTTDTITYRHIPRS